MTIISTLLHILGNLLLLLGLFSIIPLMFWIAAGGFCGRFHYRTKEKRRIVFTIFLVIGFITDLFAIVMFAPSKGLIGYVNFLMP